MPRLLRRAGFAVMAVNVVLVGVFVIGEAVDDPGGWPAVVLVASWLVPLAVLAVLAWRRPGPATWVLGVLAGAVAIGAVWSALDPQAARALEDDAGPVRALAVFVVAAALGVLGLARTRPAAVLLLVLGVAVVLAGRLGRGGMSSLAAMGLPAVLTGALYLASALAVRSDDGNLPDDDERPTQLAA